MSYTPGSGAKVQVFVPAQITATVTIVRASGGALTVYTDAARTVVQTMPLTLSAPSTAGITTSLYLADNDLYTIGCTVNSTQVAKFGSTLGAVTQYLGGDTALSFAVDQDAAEKATNANNLAQTSPVRSTFNFTPALLPKLRISKARVRTGGGDAKWLFVGDSTEWGALNSGVATTLNSRTSRMVSLLSAAGLPAAPGLAVPPVAANATFASCPLYSNGSSGAPPADWQGTRAHGFGQSAWNANATADNLVFADSRVAFDRYDIYYLASSGLGTITATATGGSAATAHGTGFVVASVTASAAAASTANVLTMSSTGNNFLVGIEPWTSTVSRVRLANAGCSSTATAQWIGDPSYGATYAIGVYAPDVVFICLGVNDAIQSVPLATYLANLQTIIAACQAAGADVILLTQGPSQETAVAALETQYTTAILGLGLPVIDNFNRLGAWSAVNALGFMDDAHHKNTLGNSDDADFIAHAVLGV